MLGIVPAALLGGRGTVWMLGTDEVFRQGRTLLTIGPLMIGLWLETFERLENIVSVENRTAIRLLERWGFTIGDERQTHRGIDFLSFWIER